jgi:hypothetical protein
VIQKRNTIALVHCLLLLDSDYTQNQKKTFDNQENGLRFAHMSGSSGFVLPSIVIYSS